MNFNIQPFSTLECFVFYKNGLVKTVHPLTVFRRTKCHGPTLTGASFASISEVRMPAIWVI